jgi:two-component system, chemotaxis family, response regulator Rcp1
MSSSIKLLLVEDSIADARLIMEVLKEEKISVGVDVVRDGDAAMAYLNRTGKYENISLPDLILLDLNLPKKDGREVLAEVKADPELSAIPVVILTTSQSEEDILKSYRLHASCYVTKPIDLEQFIHMIKMLDGFWFSAVRFPSRK